VTAKLRDEHLIEEEKNTEARVRPDPQKAAATDQFPTNPKQLKAFSGMISYYRWFIPNCSRIASLLHKLLKKDSKFEWVEAQENAFQHLKSRPTWQPILDYPDFSEFVLTTDASNRIGCRVITRIEWQGFASHIREPQFE
jgi:hypothetical protein